MEGWKFWEIFQKTVNRKSRLPGCRKVKIDRNQKTEKTVKMAKNRKTQTEIPPILRTNNRPTKTEAKTV